MLDKCLPTSADEDSKSTKELLKTLHSMSFEEAKKTRLYKTVVTNDVSFSDFCESKGVDFDYQTTLALNGVLASVFLPCTRGSISNHRGIKPGLKATALLSDLKEQYLESIDKGIIGKVYTKVFCDFETTQGMASLRIAIRRSIKQEMRLAKKEKRVPLIHDDYLNSDFFKR